MTGRFFKKYLCLPIPRCRAEVERPEYAAGVNESGSDGPSDECPESPENPFHRVHLLKLFICRAAQIFPRLSDA